MSGTDDELFTSELVALAVRALADQFEASRVDGTRFDLDKGQLLAEGLVGEADELVAAALRRGGQPPPRVVAHAAHARADASRLATPDPRLWSDAAAAWVEASEAYGVAACRWRQAEALLGGRPEPSDRARAEAALTEAWRVSLDLGALPLRQQIEDLGRRARIELGDDRAAPEADGSTLGADLGITPREVEVLGQLAAGPDRSRDRRVVVHLQEDGQRACVQPAAQAGRGQSGGGRPRRSGPRPRLSRATN